jgi:hypothetical protein
MPTKSSSSSSSNPNSKGVPAIMAPDFFSTSGSGFPRSTTSTSNNSTNIAMSSTDLEALLSSSSSSSSSTSSFSLSRQKTSNGKSTSPGTVARDREAYELAAITGEGPTGSSSSWAEQASKFADIQARLLRDMLEQTDKDAGEAAKTFYGADTVLEEDLSAILKMGLGDDDEILSTRPSVQQQVSNRQSVSQNQGGFSLNKTSNTNTAISMDDLERQLLQPTPKVHSPLVTTSRSLQSTQNVTTTSTVSSSQHAAIAKGPQIGTGFTQHKQQEQKSTLSSPSPSLPTLQTHTTQSVVSTPPSRVDIVPPPLSSLPPQGISMNLPYQLPLPPGMISQAPGMISQAPQLPTGLLPAHVAQQYATQLQNFNNAIATHPLGINGFPMEIRLQMQLAHNALQGHAVLLNTLGNQARFEQQQRNQAVHNLQQQQQQQQQQLMHQQHLMQQHQQQQPLLAPPQQSSLPVQPAVSTSTSLNDAKPSKPLSFARAVDPSLHSTVGQQRQLFPVSASISTPPLPPQSQVSSGPVTLATILSAPLPVGGLRATKRMSSQELHSINRLFFSQLSGLDPLSECYYHFALTAKQQRPGAVSMPSQGGSDVAANIMDAVAVLTQVGSAAIAAGRGKSSIDGATKPSTFKEEQLDPQIDSLYKVKSTIGQSDASLAGNILLASLPTRTTASTSFTKELAKMKKLHAIKRRLWETHNSVLGRQESMNVRAPKKTLNLTSSGNTTGNDIRREIEKFTNSISVQGAKSDAEAHLAAVQEAAADAAADAASAAEEARVAAEAARVAASSDSSESLALAAAKLTQEETRAAAVAAEATANALLAEAARSEEETASAVAIARAAAERSGENATLWAVRSRVDSALESIINLQGAAKILQDLLRQQPPPSIQQLGRHRADVAIHRLALASALGLKLGAPVPPDVVEMTADRAGKVLAKAVKDAIIKKAADVIAQAEAIQGPLAIEDDSLLLILSTYKGKKLISRAVPMLAPGDRITAVLAGIRHLPHFVASATSGSDFESADSLLASKLAQWVRTVEPVASSLEPTTPGTSPAMTRTLEVLNCWLLELQQRHPGHVIRALLQHPGASEVISALLLRGETEAAAAEALANQGTDVDEAIKEAAKSDSALWRLTTDTLGRAFVEAE